MVKINTACFMSIQYMNYELLIIKRLHDLQFSRKLKMQKTCSYIMVVNWKCIMIYTK